MSKVPDPFGGLPVTRAERARNEEFHKQRNVPYFQRELVMKPDPYGGAPVPDRSVGLFGETAFRDKVTRKVYPSGVIHSPRVVPESLRETLGRIEAGFLDRKGKFWSRDDVERRFGGNEPGESVELRKRGILKDKIARKSSGGGGEVQVAAHERDGHAVQAYTRSRPS